MNISIPALHVSDTSQVDGSGVAHVVSRKDAVAAGTFSLTVRPTIKFLPPDAYPSGGFTLQADLTDSLRGTFSSTSVDLITSHGRDAPTIFLTGKCTVKPGEHAPGNERAPIGLRYWLMVVGNRERAQDRETPDIVSFAIHDHVGVRVAYGTGAISAPGSFSVKAE